jgi:GNAT superfamily N-acetyltransferase
VSISIEEATPERWADVVGVFGRRGDDPSWDWCRTFLTPGPVLPGTGKPDNRAALQNEIEHADVPPALIAYLDGNPAGWSRVGPRDRFPGVVGNRTLRNALSPDPGAWWVTCFATRQDARGRGIGTALLRADAEYARRHGATALEGYPVDVANLKAKRVGASALYTGTLPLFLAAGFTEIARPSPTRPLMRLEL